MKIHPEMQLLYNINRLAIMMAELRTLQIRVMLAERELVNRKTQQ